MGMTVPREPATGRSPWRFRLAHGLDLLDDCSETAFQSRRNAVCRLLFAVQDGSVFRRYETVDDASVLDFAVRLTGDLVVRITLEGETFTIADKREAVLATAWPATSRARHRSLHSGLVSPHHEEPKVDMVVDKGILHHRVDDHSGRYQWQLR